MFELTVCGLDDSIKLIETGWPTRIVSLVAKEIAIAGAHHRQLWFHDIPQPMGDYIHPTMAHLLEIFEFTKDLTDEDRVLVHCLAGISRSTAVAIGITIQHGMNFDDAFAHVAMVRPVLLPNSLLIEYIDEHFQLDGALVEHAVQHRRSVKNLPLHLVPKSHE